MPRFGTRDIPRPLPPDEVTRMFGEALKQAALEGRTLIYIAQTAEQPTAALLMAHGTDRAIVRMSLSAVVGSAIQAGGATPAEVRRIVEEAIKKATPKR